MSLAARCPGRRRLERASPPQQGVNAELMPLVRMTVPRGVEDFDIEQRVPAGTTLGRSWLLLFGLVAVRLGSHPPRCGSSPDGLPRALGDALSAPVGAPPRTRRPGGHGRLHGHGSSVRFEPRLPFLAPLLRPLFRVRSSATAIAGCGATFGGSGAALTTVDARGLCVPDAARDDQGADGGACDRATSYVVLATDPEAALDLAAWAADEGHAFAERAASRLGGVRAAQDGDSGSACRPAGQPAVTTTPPRRGSPPPDSSPLAGSRATACTPPK